MNLSLFSTCPLSPPSATPKIHTQKSLVVPCPSHMPGSSLSREAPGKTRAARQPTIREAGSSLKALGGKNPAPTTSRIESHPSTTRSSFLREQTPSSNLQKHYGTLPTQKEGRRNSHSAIEVVITSKCDLSGKNIKIIYWLHSIHLRAFIS